LITINRKKPRNEHQDGEEKDSILEKKDGDNYKETTE